MEQNGQQKMNKISQRVISVRESLGLSQSAFAAKIGFSRNYVSRVERGVNEPSRKFESAISLAEREASIRSAKNAPFGAEPPMTVAESPERQYGFSGSEVRFIPLGTPRRDIPIISSAQAGAPIEFLALPESWLDVTPYTGKDPNAFALRLEGDSMEPKFSSGTIITLEPMHPPGNGDLVVAAVRDKGVLFKIFHHSGDGKEITLSSYNPAYPPMVWPREKFHWIYRVVGAYRRL